MRFLQSYLPGFPVLFSLFPFSARCAALGRVFLRRQTDDICTKSILCEIIRIKYLIIIEGFVRRMGEASTY